MQSGSRFIRGTLSAFAIAATASLSVTGCAAPAAQQASAGKTGGNLVVGVTTDADTLLPWKATQFQAVSVLQNIYGTLTEFDKDLAVVPGLAKSWEAAGDGLTVTFKLREGVTFSDGSALDSKDVKYSLDKIKEEATGAVARTSLAAVTSIEAPDPATVVLRMSSPDAALPANLAVINMAILSSDDAETSLMTRPNGSGPFTLKERVPSQSMKLARNDSYWGEKAKLDSVELRVIPDESSIVSAIQSGNVNFAVFNSPLVAKTAAGPNTSVAKTPQLSYHALQLNAGRTALADVNVRLAIQCAVDRQQVLDTAALGEGEVTGPITSPAYKSNADDRPCPKRDLAKANEYLKKAGKSDGVTLSTIVSQGEYATSVDEAQNLKAQLAEAKITLTIDVLESGAFVNRWKAGDFDAAVALNGGRPDPDGMYGRYFTSTGNLNKVAGYNSPTLDTLFASGKSTSDPQQRKDIYSKVSRELENNAAWVWLFTSYTYTTTSSSVQGFIPMANGSLQYLRTTTIN